MAASAAGNSFPCMGKFAIFFLQLCKAFVTIFSLMVLYVHINHNQAVCFTCSKPNICMGIFRPPFHYLLAVRGSILAAVSTLFFADSRYFGPCCKGKNCKRWTVAVCLCIGQRCFNQTASPPFFFLVSSLPNAIKNSGVASNTQALYVGSHGLTVFFPMNPDSINLAAMLGLVINFVFIATSSPPQSCCNWDIPPLP